MKVKKIKLQIVTDRETRDFDISRDGKIIGLIEDILITERGLYKLPKKIINQALTPGDIIKPIK